MSKALRLSTRDAIIDAGFDVFRRDRSASLLDVADRAGVGRATLHRHFASRDDLMNTLALVAMEEMDEAVYAACEDVRSHTEALRLSLAALIPLGDRYGFLSLEPLDGDPEIAAAYQLQIDEMRAAVEQAKCEGTFDRAVPTAWITQAYDNLLYAAWESVRAGEATHAQAADLAWRTITKGLGTNGSGKAER